MNTQKFMIVLAGLLITASILTACGSQPPFPLAEPGPYQFGTQMSIKFSDPNRGNRAIGLYVWYPATLPADTEASKYNFNAEPDRDGAPIQ